MTTIRPAEAALVEAREATRRARVARDNADYFRIVHASIPSYRHTALTAAEALAAAEQLERDAEAALSEIQNAIALEGGTP